VHPHVHIKSHAALVLLNYTVLFEVSDARVAGLRVNIDISKKPEGC